MYQEEYFLLLLLLYWSNVILLIRFTKDCPTFKDDLDIMKFICKDFWNGIYRKQIDNLRTNHQVWHLTGYGPKSILCVWETVFKAFNLTLISICQGTYVLQDNKFALLTQFSCRTQQLEESSKVSSIIVVIAKYF